MVPARFTGTRWVPNNNDVPPVSKDPTSYINDYDDDKPKFYFDIPGPVHICDIVKSFDNKSSMDLV
jgi:hypothetical protein